MSSNIPQPSPIHSTGGSDTDISNLDSNDSDSAEDVLSLTLLPSIKKT